MGKPTRNKGNNVTLTLLATGVIGVSGALLGSAFMQSPADVFAAGNKTGPGRVDVETDTRSSPAAPVNGIPQSSGGESAEQGNGRSLWVNQSWVREYAEEGHGIYRTDGTGVALDALAVGDQLRIHLPDGHGQWLGEIEEESEGVHGVRVWSGNLPDAGPFGGLSVVRGNLETHLTIITDESTWVAVVDNQTGQTTMVDERERMQYQYLSEDDGALPEEHDLPTPPGAEANR